MNAQELVITCGFCFSPIDKAVKLDCDHNFCYDCAEAHQLTVEDTDKKSVTCPLCRSASFISDLDSRLNEDLNRYIALLKGGSSAQFLCQWCQLVPATKQCNSCTAAYCEDCFVAAHKLAGRRKHEMHPLVDPPNSFKVRCTHTGHEEYKAEFFCTECDELCCAYCLRVSPHLGHSNTDLESAAAEAKRQMEAERPEVNKTKRRLKETTETFLTLAKRYTSTYDKITGSVKSRFDALRQQIDEKEKETYIMLSSLRNLGDEQMMRSRLDLLLKMNAFLSAVLRIESSNSHSMVLHNRSLLREFLANEVRYVPLDGKCFIIEYDRELPFVPDLPLMLDLRPIDDYVSVGYTSPFGSPKKSREGNSAPVDGSLAPPLGPNVFDAVVVKPKPPGVSTSSVMSPSQLPPDEMPYSNQPRPGREPLYSGSDMRPQSISQRRQSVSPPPMGERRQVATYQQRGEYPNGRASSSLSTTDLDASVDRFRRDEAGGAAYRSNYTDPQKKCVREAWGREDSKHFEREPTRNASNVYERGMEGSSRSLGNQNRHATISESMTRAEEEGGRSTTGVNERGMEESSRAADYQTRNHRIPENMSRAEEREAKQNYSPEPLFSQGASSPSSPPTFDRRRKSEQVQMNRGRGTSAELAAKNQSAIVDDNRQFASAANVEEVGEQTMNSQRYRKSNDKMEKYATSEEYVTVISENQLSSVAHQSPSIRSSRAEESYEERIVEKPLFDVTSQSSRPCSLADGEEVHYTVMEPEESFEVRRVSRSERECSPGKRGTTVHIRISKTRSRGRSLTPPPAPCEQLKHPLRLTFPIDEDIIMVPFTGGKQFRCVVRGDASLQIGVKSLDTFRQILKKFPEDNGIVSWRIRLEIFSDTIVGVVQKGKEMPPKGFFWKPGCSARVDAGLGKRNQAVVDKLPICRTGTIVGFRYDIHKKTLEVFVHDALIGVVLEDLEPDIQACFILNPGEIVSVLE